VIWYEYTYADVELTLLGGRKALVKIRAKAIAKIARRTALEYRFIAPP
jgi:hypothetical protein